MSLSEFKNLFLRLYLNGIYDFFLVYTNYACYFVSLNNLFYDIIWWSVLY